MSQTTSTKQHETRRNGERNNRNQTLGHSGEEAAAQYLQNQGWQVVDRNWRCRDGEIDIVAVEGDCLVVVEVKTRTSAKYGRAVESVTGAKVTRLRALGAVWALAHEARLRTIRVDVIGLERFDGTWRVDHRRGVQE